MIAELKEARCFLREVDAKPDLLIHEILRLMGVDHQMAEAKAAAGQRGLGSASRHIRLALRSRPAHVCARQSVKIGLLPAQVANVRDRVVPRVGRQHPVEQEHSIIPQSAAQRT
jgi:hypothetical protein